MSNVAIILAIFNRTLIIYLGVFLGFVFIKSPLNKYRKQFITFTINIFTPMLIFVSFVKIGDFNDNDWAFPIIAALLVTIIGIITPKVIAKISKQPSPKPAELCTSSFSNGLNFPFPVIFALAPEGLGAAGLFLAVAIIMRNTVGLYLSGIKMDKEALMSIIKFPPIWGIVLGIPARLFLQEAIIPVTQLVVVDFIFQLGIFATLMTIGFSLKKPNFDYLQSFFRVGMARYVISLLFALLLIFPFNLNYIIAIPILVQMVAPPAVYNGLYAEKFNLDTELTSQVIVFLTFIALAILPLELYIIQILFLS